MLPSRIFAAVAGLSASTLVAVALLTGSPANAATASALKAGKTQTTTAALGDVVRPRFTVTNEGTEAVHKPTLRLHWSGALRPAVRYGNCAYLAADAICEFGDDLGAHTTYTLSEQAFTVDPGFYAPASSSLQALWYSGAEAIDKLADLRAANPQPGTGPAAALVASEPAPVADGITTTLLVNVTGNQGADLQAVGATVHGPVGSTVTAKIGVKNAGPANLSFSDVRMSKLTLFTVPVGTTVVSVPRLCAIIVDDQPVKAQPGKPVYVCAAGPLTSGATNFWEFGLRIDKAQPARGTVRVDYPASWYPVTEHNLNPGNDQADVVVTSDDAATPAATPPATPATSTGGPAGGSGGGTSAGGSLPVTGDNTAILAGSGLALVALGGAAYAVTRRRRSRFSA